MGGPCPGTVRRLCPDGPELSATVDRMRRLAMAPSTASQWNQRKLAPNYSLVSVKDGSGAPGVSVCEGWVAESLRDLGLQSAQNAHRGQGHDYTHGKAGGSASLFWSICAPVGSASSPGCHNRNHLCSVSDPTGLITHTPAASASGFSAPWSKARCS